MDKPDRRPVSLAGLGLISAGAVLGLALATPASAAPSDKPARSSTPVAEKPAAGAGNPAAVAEKDTRS